MAIKTLNKFKKVRYLLVRAKSAYLRKVWGMDIDPSAEMSLSAFFDKTYPRGIHVGAQTYIAFEARILTHDMIRRIKTDTRIGRNCFIGGRSLILPGVEIGDHCIVGAGSVVTRSVPSGSIVAGNPAKVIYSDVTLLTYGRIDPENPPERTLCR